MAERTAIGWTDSTFNAWIGCTKVSPACDHCYAERDMATRRKVVEWGPGAARKRTSAANWKLPERWNRDGYFECACGRRGSIAEMDKTECVNHTRNLVRRRVFSLSLGDWLDNEVPIEWLVDFLDLIRRTPNLDWQLLTKRIGNWRTRLYEAGRWLQAADPLTSTVDVEGLYRFVQSWLADTPPHNVWIGSTMESQTVLDRDVDKLCRVPAAVRFLSIEPQQELVDVGMTRGLTQYRREIGWIITGGESGPKARPYDLSWPTSLIAQGRAAGVPVFVKQLGRNIVAANGMPLHTKHHAGGDPAEWPEQLRVRQFPSALAPKEPSR